MSESDVDVSSENKLALGLFLSDELGTRYQVPILVMCYMYYKSCSSYILAPFDASKAMYKRFT